MAAVKDPTKTPPLTAPQTAKPRADVATALDATAAEDQLQLNNWDNQNDFSAMKNSYRKADQDMEAAAIIGLGGPDSGPSMFSKLLNEGNAKTLSFEDAMKMGTLVLQDILRLDTSDPRVQSMRTGTVTDYNAGQKYYVVGQDLEKYESRRAAQSSLGSLGLSPSHTGRYPPTKFEVRNAGDIQKDLVNSINRAAEITGVPPAMLGALAGIESGFNNPKMQRSPSGAVGVVQQTGGYRDTMWAKHGNFIAEHVPEAREAMKGGLTREEKYALAFNEDAAFIMVGRRAKELEKKYGLDLNTPRGMAIVYLEHNSGEGSVKRLLNGQMTEASIRNWNPAIYRGNDTPAAVIAATERKMVSFASAYEKRADQIEGIHMAAAKPAADSAIAKASASSAADLAIAKASTSSAAALKDGAVGSITNKPDAPDSSNMDVRDRKLAQSGPAPVVS